MGLQAPNRPPPACAGAPQRNGCARRATKTHKFLPGDGGREVVRSGALVARGLLFVNAEEAMKASELRVGDLMTTAVITFGPDDTVGQADAEMRLAEIRHLPVVDERKRVVGIVSNRDVLRTLREGRAVAVAAIMSRTVLTVSPETPAAQAAALMLEHRIGSLPVVGEGGTLVGLVTETDFLALAERLLRGEAPER